MGNVVYLMIPGDDIMDPEGRDEEEEDEEEADESSQTTETGNAGVTWETVFGTRALNRASLPMSTDVHAGKTFFMTYGGGPEGGYAVSGEEPRDGGSPVWAMHRSWFEHLTFTLLEGKRLVTKTMDEDVFKCRLRDEGPSDESEEGG